jgi:hypothetical protein
MSCQQIYFKTNEKQMLQSDFLFTGYSEDFSPLITVRKRTFLKKLSGCVVKFYLPILISLLPYQALAQVDTFLPAPVKNLPLPRKNFIASSFVITLDTVGMENKETTFQGKKFAFKNITEKLQYAVNLAIQKGGGTIRIPKGNYYINKNVVIDPYRSGPIAISIYGNGSIIAPVYVENQQLVCIMTKCYSNPVKYELRVEDLEFDGKYFFGNTGDFFKSRKNPPGLAVCAIAALNLKYVHIANCKFRNLYGQAILVASQDFNKNSDTSIRAQYAEVYNNIIYNCWGQQFFETPNKQFDHYGDGILLSCVAKGAVFNNIIYNNLYETQFYGRCGIATDFQTENIQIIRNRIHGYDRNLHFENSRGGMQIRYNKMTGSEVGILVWPMNTHLKHQNPLSIEYNYISNWGIPMNFQTAARVMSKYSGLINFFSDSKIHEGSVVRFNTIEYTSQGFYGIFPERNPDRLLFLLSCQQQKVQFSNNKFITVQKDSKKPTIFIKYPNITFTKNTYPGVLLKKN